MIRSTLPRGVALGALLSLSFASAACSSGAPTSFGDDSSGDDGGAGDDGSTGGDDASTSPEAGSRADASGGDSSVHDSATSTPDTSMTVTSDDGFSASRTACINEINRLRATQSLTPYALQNTDSINTCVDGQATSDEAANSPHQAWLSGADSCNGNGQDECEGYGTDPAGIVACLDAMWDEKNQSNCTGCVGCTQFGGACPNCDFYGNDGPECGHYVNMSAVYFSSVACGFAASPGTWAAQNFFQ